MKHWIALAGLLALTGASATYADVVVLDNGDRISGTVDSMDGRRLLIETPYAGVVAIAMSAVVQLETDAEFDVATDDGVVTGRFEGGAVVPADGAPVAVDLASVKRIGQNRLQMPEFTREWSSRADVSYSLSNGNSDTESLNTLVESVLKRERAEHKLSLRIDTEEAEEERTKDVLDVDYGYKRFVSEQWYASGNAEYFRDDLKGIEQRITLGAGMGYQFWDNSFGALSTELGVSAVNEELEGEDTETNPAVRWGLDYKRYLFAKRAELFHQQSVLFIPDSDRGEVLSSSTGLRYALNDRIDTAVRVDVNHETDPPPDNSKTDVTYTLGIGIKF